MVTTVLVAWAAQFGWLGGVGHTVRTEARAADAPNYSPGKTGLIEVLRSDRRGRTTWRVWTGYRAVAQRDHVPTATTAEELAPSWMLAAAHESADWRDAPKGIETEHGELGWPLRALGWSADPGPPGTVQQVRGAVVIGRPGGGYTGLSGLDVILLPWRPAWWGLLVNTAIYSTAWWITLGIPGACLAWFRRRSGHCPVCGYARTGLAPGALCPECGKPNPVVNTSTA